MKAKPRIFWIPCVDIISTDGEILVKSINVWSAQAYVRTYNEFYGKLACFLVDRAAVLKAYKLRPSRAKARNTRRMA